MGVWHPILASVEVAPGVFELRDQYGSTYAVVRWVEVGSETGWRAVLTGAADEGRQLIGYYSGLLAAVKAAHLVWVGRAGDQPKPEYPTWSPPTPS